VEHEIKIAVFTLINEINKKGKSLLQQLEVSVRASKKHTLSDFQSDNQNPISLLLNNWPLRIQF